MSTLVGLLRCLACHGELSRRSPERLRCESCGAEYPIRDGTPRMLSSGPPESEVRQRTGESFAYEWRHFGGLRSEWRRNFLEYMRPHAPESLSGRLLLDVGAGSGRHSFQAANLGARVVAVDVGASIDVARRNLPPDVLTVQADAEDLPFEPGTFDFVMSIGVLHHLPDPERALRTIAALARPGGSVQIYLYWLPERRWHRRVLSLVSEARRVTTRLPHPLLHALCYPLAAVLVVTIVLPYRMLRRLPGARRFAELFPLKVYANYPFGVLVNDQFDRFSAPLERRFTKEAVEAMMRAAGLSDVQVLPNHGWVATGVRQEG